MRSSMINRLRKSVGKKPAKQHEEQEPSPSSGPSTMSPEPSPRVKRGVAIDQEKAEQQSPPVANTAAKESDQPRFLEEDRLREYRARHASQGENTRGSTWKRAYDQLDKDLRDRYMEVLESEWKSQNGADTYTNEREQHEFLIENGLQTLEKKKTRVQNGIETIATGIEGVRAFVDQAVKVSPEASLVWAGVCTVLPLFTNIKAASDGRRDGFVYVTERLRYYLALEKNLQPEKELRDRRPDWHELMERLYESLLALFRKLLDFQIRAVIQLYRPNLARDAFRPEDWAGMKTTISQLEHTLDGNLRHMDTAFHQQTLPRIESILGDTNKSLETFLGLFKNSSELQEKGLEMQKQQLDVTNQILERMPRKDVEPQECHQLFRLSPGGQDDYYEKSKDRNPEPAEGTCAWFLTHPSYDKWLGKSNHPLVVTADPGCGKSVLARYLVDSHLSGKDPNSTVCYFFFDKRTQSTIRQLLCALIHQLVNQKFGAIIHALPEYRNNKNHLVNVESLLLNIFRKMVADPSTGCVVLILDALDECEEGRSSELIKYFLGLHSEIEHQREKSGNEGKAYQFTFLATTRPYKRIMSPFNHLIETNPETHISADDFAASIAAEINIFIETRAAELKSQRRLSEDTKPYLVDRLRATRQQTYLWVQLTLEYIAMSEHGSDRRELDKIIDSPSMTFYQAYRNMINSSKNMTLARRVFSIMLAAYRTLTLQELYLALELSDSPSTEPRPYRSDFGLDLRDWCGLLVKITENKVDFSHATARDFLLEEGLPSDENASSEPITEIECHETLARVCLDYVEVVILPIVSRPWRYPKTKLSEIISADGDNNFLVYVSSSWFDHIQQARLEGDKTLSRMIQRLCDPQDTLCKAWTETYVPSSEIAISFQPVNTLWVASFTGMTALVEDILASGDVVDSRNHDGQNTLMIAALQGHHRVLSLLLTSKEIRRELRDSSRRGVLQAAVFSGNAATVQELLQSDGIDLSTWDSQGRTPIEWALRYGSSDVIRAFLDSKLHEAINAKNSLGKTALMIACECRMDSVFQELVSLGCCELNAQDCYQRTALVYSILFGRDVCAQALLQVAETDASIPDQNGITPLTYAVRIGRDDILKQLIWFSKVDINTTDKFGRTALHEAARCHSSVSGTVLDHVKDKDLPDRQGWTPLMIAAHHGHMDMVQQLLDTKAVDVNRTNQNGTTALFKATNGGHSNVVQALLDASADSTIPDCEGCTPLMIAAYEGNMEICELLLPSSDLKVVDNEERDAMWYAELRNHTDIMNLFRDHLSITG